MGVMAPVALTLNDGYRISFSATCRVSNRPIEMLPSLAKFKTRTQLRMQKMNTKSTRHSTMPPTTSRRYGRSSIGVTPATPASQPLTSGVLLLALLAMPATLARADALAEPNAKIKVHPVVALKAWAFPLEDVRLLDGPFKHAMELDQKYLLSLDVDRLLLNFRVNAGLSSTAEPLRGWEDPKCELRGHFVGHYLSACALMYASTGDHRFKDKGDAVVAGLAECQAKLGSGYLSAYPESLIDRVEKQSRVWAPYYTLHKILAGLVDMYESCDNQQALEIARKFGD